jgi:hypothetical protein
MHAVEDASIPWRSPDGREFYRIRTGMVFDQDPASWPCAYKVPEDYARLPHVRDKKKVLTDLQCKPRVDAQATADIARALAKALTRWSTSYSPPVRPGVLDVVDEGTPRTGLLDPSYLEAFRTVLTP